MLKVWVHTLVTDKCHGISKNFYICHSLGIFFNVLPASIQLENN